ncbi:MAG: U32 family peptidase, partial [Oscillospiraceae bacterium]|nr:U32 family peptidase [Oscillospiraceae bacterium]
MKRPEILAPAGTMDALKAAVNCGADSVYFGGKALNARRNAENFDEEQLREAVSYAHLHGTKLFQTLNIAMFDGEEKELLKAAEIIAKLGIDAAIVQDWGVLSILKKAVPELPLYASTQMAVHNLAGAKMAESLGCKRIVLAREMTAAEIEKVVKNVSAQVEVFVHGALCMSVSGQCYLSSMLGGRSGNRGLCAQPCRLPFGCEKATHALSLKDLSLVERVRELCALGVSSLKIEGRMKRPEYVAAAVTALRQALDNEAPDMSRLRSVFSRSGFTTGYFDDKRDGDMFGTRQKEDVTAAAGVLSELARLANNDIGKVGLEGAFTAEEDMPISLALRDSDKNSVYVEGEAPQKALNKPTDEERVRQNLSKTGGTAFHFDDLDIALDEGLMIPVSQINALRREALEQLSEIRGKLRPMKFTGELPELAPSAAASGKKPQIRARCTANQLSPELIKRCNDFILPLGDIPAAIAMGITADRIIAEIPRMLFTG